MISYEYMKKALKKYPRAINKAFKDKDYELVVRLDTEQWMYKFILESNDKD